MKATEIKKGIYWVGAIDYTLRYFHGYSTEKGSTYNAYLIVDDKITLIDTVKSAFADEMIERIASVVDPADIDVIICNHVEPDHSGSLLKILGIAKKAKVYASMGSGVSGLQKYYGNIEIQGVKSGESLNIGKHTLDFLATPMVHWPDNMFTYMKDQQLLFSNDAFGQHFATEERFDGNTDLREALYQAKKYYANIVLPYTQQVQAALTAASGLKIAMIAPSHGIIWRDHIPDILSLYTDFTSRKTLRKAVVVYDTMWHSTEKIARTLAERFTEQSIACRVMDLQNNHISDIITEISDAEYLAVGSPTLNNNMLPTVASFLCYLKGLAPKNKKCIAFGSYGWGGQSIKQIEEALTAMGYVSFIPAIKCQYLPTPEFLKSIRLS